jgi:CheY-like chemotaxis protein
LIALGLGTEKAEYVITRHTVLEARRRLNILLAEDNVVNQKLAVKILENRGHQVHLATNGKEALQAFKAGGFDIILMDVQMPVMDGLTAIREIRKTEDIDPESGVVSREQTRKIPIVAMTAHAMKGDRERCLEAGMDGYISKPIKPDELFKAIEDFGIQKHQEDIMPWSSKADDSETAGPVLDFEAAMKTVGGDEDLFKEVGVLLIDSLPGLLGKIREGITAGDAGTVESSAHGLKGSLGNFGKGPAYKAAQRLEQMGNRGELGGAERGFEELVKYCISLEEEINAVTH